MKKNKSMVILQLYDELLSGKEINLDQSLIQYDISLSTFYRYINIIRDFIAKNSLIIVYSQKTRNYRFEKNFTEIF